MAVSRSGWRPWRDMICCVWQDEEQWHELENGRRNSGSGRELHCDDDRVGGVREDVGGGRQHAAVEVSSAHESESEER